MSSAGLPIDDGLLARFRAAGARIAWRPSDASPERQPKRTTRIAHLNDEEARVESWGRPPKVGLEVASGPLGALVLVLEADLRTAVPALESRDGGVDPGFPNGAIRATWGSARTGGKGPTIRDLIELARYALA
jgi:hypothetical protein